MSLFHDGDVQSGIAAALQQSKAVVCFVSGDDAESDQWGSQWLWSAQDSLESNAICLSINSESREASQLAAFYPITQTPTVLVIRAGKLVDQLLPGLSQDSFTSRLELAVKPTNTSSPPGVPGQQPLQTSSAVASTGQTPSDLPTPTASLVPSQASTNVGSEPSSAPQSREGRLRPSQEESYMQQQARRKAEAAQDRERVRALIEADKQERKERERERHEQAAGFSSHEQNSDSKAKAAGRPSRSSNQATSTIQVRLLDGSTMRKRFEPSDTLRGAVRSWIDRNRSDADSPYTLKLVLTPMPSRAISDADERQSLKDLGLVPNASMALVPVKNFIQAYQAGGPRGFVKGAPSLLLGYLLALWAFIWSALLSVSRIGRAPTDTQGAGQTSETEPRSSTSKTTSSQVQQPPASASNVGIRIRTLRDQRVGQDDQQLYNGNQLNFEPKREHGDDEDP